MLKLLIRKLWTDAVWILAWCIPFVRIKWLEDKATSLHSHLMRKEAEWCATYVSRSGWSGMNVRDGNARLWLIDYGNSSNFPGMDGLYIVITKEFITTAKVAAFAGGIQGVVMCGSQEAHSSRTIRDKYPDSRWIRIPLPKNPPYKVDMMGDTKPVVTKMIR